VPNGKKSVSPDPYSSARHGCSVSLVTQATENAEDTTATRAGLRGRKGHARAVGAQPPHVKCAGDATATRQCVGDAVVARQCVSDAVVARQGAQTQPLQRRHATNALVGRQDPQGIASSRPARRRAPANEHNRGHTRRTVTGRPPRTRSDSIASGTARAPAGSSNRKSRATMAAMRVASIMPRWLPTQTRGPAPNGI
jgi:hypothetical protein